MLDIGHLRCPGFIHISCLYDHQNLTMGNKARRKDDYTYARVCFTV